MREPRTRESAARSPQGTSQADPSAPTQEFSVAGHAFACSEANFVARSIAGANRKTEAQGGEPVVFSDPELGGLVACRVEAGQQRGLESVTYASGETSGRDAPSGSGDRFALARK